MRAQDKLFDNKVSDIVFIGDNTIQLKRGISLILFNFGDSSVEVELPKSQSEMELIFTYNHVMDQSG